MSCSIEDHAFSDQEISIIEQKLAQKIMRELRQEYKDTRHAVKLISKRTGISLNTTKRWYNGHNPPTLRHLLILTRHYNCALRAFLEVSGNGYLIAHIRDEKQNDQTSIIGQSGDANVPVNVPVNLESTRMDDHQRWFLEAICNNMKPSAASLVKQWGISPRAAKDVISNLKERKLIAFVGARKNGRYVLL